MHHYALALADGAGVEKDLERSVQFMQLAADRGDADAQWRYAKILQDGELVARDDELAADYLKRSSRQGNQMGTKLYSDALAVGRGCQQSSAKAVDLLFLYAPQEVA
jgi:TPR repeat protein